MDASKSLSCENNNSSLFSAVPDLSNMYQNKDSNLISDQNILFYSGMILTAEVPHTKMLNKRNSIIAILP